VPTGEILAPFSRLFHVLNNSRPELAEGFSLVLLVQNAVLLFVDRDTAEKIRCVIALVRVPCVVAEVRGVAKAGVRHVECADKFNALLGFIKGKIEFIAIFCVEDVAEPFAVFGFRDVEALADVLALFLHIARASRGVDNRGEAHERFLGFARKFFFQKLERGVGVAFQLRDFLFIVLARVGLVENMVLLVPQIPASEAISAAAAVVREVAVVAVEAAVKEGGSVHAVAVHALVGELGVIDETAIHAI